MRSPLKRSIFIRFTIGIILCFIAALPFGSYAVAEDQPTPAASQPAPTEAAPQDTPAIDSESQVAVTSPGNVTVDFKEADIQNVLRVLSFKSGVNIVAGKDVVGSVTIRLVDVPWEKALDVVLKTYGFAYDRDDNIVRVTTLENLKKGELSTEVFTLNYAQASDVEKSLKDMLSERGRIRSDIRSNSVIVTDMPTSIQSIQKVVERLDRSTPQVLIQAKVIETTLGDADKLGIKWNASVSVSGSARPTTMPFSALQMDNAALRTMLPEGRGTTETATSGATATNEDFPLKDNVHQPTFPVADKGEFKFGTLDFSQFQAILQLIQQRNKSKILSEPHIITLNNKEAKILVGEVIAIPTFERNSTTGKMEITGYKDRDLGIRLSVVPQVNDTNEIVVAIHPEITSLLGYDELTADIKAPRFSTREAVTDVRIRSGETIAIGGLIKENEVKNKTKVPLLGDLPLLDKIFSHDDNTVEKTDLLFFMTVQVLGDKSPAPMGHPSAA